VKVVVNGSEVELDDGATVADLVRTLDVAAREIAVERNHALVRRRDHPTTVLAEGDVVEVVTLVGGG